MKQNRHQYEESVCIVFVNSTCFSVLKVAMLYKMVKKIKFHYNFFVDFKDFFFRIKF